MRERQLGDFILEEPLQLGRWTEVWRARWLKAALPEYRLVALKILRIEFALDPRQIERFNNEIRTTSQLQHPNIAAPIAWGLFNDGRRYFATRFIVGLPLSNWMNGQPLPFDFVWRVLAQLAQGLDYMHTQKVVHRDIKPDNILIHPQHGTAYLVDFSIALSRDVKRVTLVRELVGTVAYMAPEIIEGESITPLTDIYSLGIVAFEMLTGRTPFQGETLELTYKHVKNTPPVASSLNPQLPPAVDKCLAWALAKKPRRRPGSAGIFVDRLARAITGQPEPRNWLSLLLGLLIAALIFVISLAIITMIQN